MSFLRELQEEGKTGPGQRQRFKFSLNPELHARLMYVAGETGLYLSDVLERLIEKHVPPVGEMMAEQAGKDLDKDLSEDI